MSDPDVVRQLKEHFKSLGISVEVEESWNLVLVSPLHKRFRRRLEDAAGLLPAATFGDYNLNGIEFDLR